MRVQDIYLSLLEIIRSDKHLKIFVTDTGCYGVKSRSDSGNTIYETYVINYVLHHLHAYFSRDAETMLNTTIVDSLLLLHRYFINLSDESNYHPCYSSYYYTSTKVLLALAQMLEPHTKLSRYQILFPNISVVDYEVTNTSLHDKDRQLHEFIVTEDGHAIIEVKACLDFAVDDGVLKHTYLVDKKVKVLSESESSRVINHSKQARAYWDAICQKVKIEKHGLNLGAGFKRLAVCLRKGGVHTDPDAAEFNSGAKANIGIHAFFEWFNLLEEDERIEIASFSARGLSDKLGDLIDRLRCRPDDERYNRSIYCVELIACSIETILDENPILFDTYPRNAPIPVGEQIEFVRQCVIKAGQELECAIQRPGYCVDEIYWRRRQDEKLIAILVLPDLTNFAEHAIEKYFLIDQSALIYFFKRMDADNRIKFIKNVCMTVSPDTAITILESCSTHDDVILLLELLAPNIILYGLGMDSFEERFSEVILSRGDIPESALLEIFQKVFEKKYDEDLDRYANTLLDRIDRSRPTDISKLVYLSYCRRVSRHPPIYFDKTYYEERGLLLPDLLVTNAALFCTLYADLNLFVQLLLYLPKNEYTKLFDLLASAREFFLKQRAKFPVIFRNKEQITEVLNNKMHLYHIFMSLSDTASFDVLMAFLMGCGRITTVDDRLSFTAKYLCMHERHTLDAVLYILPEKYRSNFVYRYANVFYLGKPSTTGIFKAISNSISMQGKVDKCPRRLVPGLDNFDCFIKTKSSIFIDKSDFISHALGFGEKISHDRKIVIIERPIGFGKSLNMSMLKCFLSHDINGKPNRHATQFANLEVGLHPEVMAHFAQYVVVDLNIKDFRLDSKGEVIEEIMLECMGKLYSHFEYLLDSDYLSPSHKECFTNVTLGNVGDVPIEFLLQKLIELLHAHHSATDKKKIFVLIDDYNTTVINHPKKHKLHYFINSFLTVGLDETPCRAVLMGHPDIENRFGFPQAARYTALKDDLFTNDFGFTEKDVRQILVEYLCDAPEKVIESTLSQLTHWHGGYQIPYNDFQLSQPMYHPRRLVLFLANDQMYLIYRQLLSSSDLKIIHHMLIKYKKVDAAIYEEFISQIKQLFLDEPIHISFQQDAAKIFWLAFFKLGMLTITKCLEEENGIMYQVTLVNQESRKAFKKYFGKAYEADYSQEDTLRCKIGR